MRTESEPDEHRSQDALTDMPAGLRHADTVSSATSAGLSVVCMASMATAFAATGTAAGAGAAGLSGMAAMGSGGALSVLPVIFEAVGLGTLNHLPNELLQPLLIVSLGLSVGATYLASRRHGRRGPLLLSAASAVLLYLSIYAAMSDALYLVSFVGLLAAAIWGLWLGRATRPVARRTQVAAEGRSAR